MDMQDAILLLVGIGLGYYVYAHYAKSGRMA
jgi:hypothetical protein